YGPQGLGPGVFWRFSGGGQGPREERALVFAAIALAGFGIARLIRPARVVPRVATRDELAAAKAVAATSDRASAQLALLGDKALMFNEGRSSFIMYGIAGQSWVTVGDPVGPPGEAAPLIEQFVRECDQRGGWPVFY